MKALYRLLLLGFFAFSWTPSNATHIIGGDIQYEFIGTQTSGGVTQYLYNVRLAVYRQTLNGAAGLGPTATIDIKSASCGINFSHTLQRISVSQPSETFLCVPQANAPFVPELHYYETAPNNPLVLTQRCSDYLISWDLCCRPAGVTNIVNSSSKGFYFEAELNLRQGLQPNSSPFFTSMPIAYHCVSSSISYFQKATEPDTDSLEYQLVDPRELVGANVQLVPYSGTFTKSRPFSDVPSNPYSLDPATGEITFTAAPAAAGEVSVIALRVNEYRFDSLYLIWEKVGSSNREIQVYFNGSCNPNVNAGVSLDPNAPGVTVDSLGRQVKEYNCLDTTVTLEFNINIECNSVSPDGSDFRITAPNGQPIPIKKATPTCNNNLETRSIELSLYKPLIFNGDYYLYSKTGNDGNTLLNACGKPMSEFDTIILRVDDCLNPEFGLLGVTVDEDRRNRIDFFVDTTTIGPEYIDFVRVFRSDDSSKTYLQINTGNYQQGFIYDAVPGPLGVDQQYYYYGIELVASGQDLGRNGALHTINLTGSRNSNGQITLQWSNYGGASYSELLQTEYKVQLGEGTPPTNMTWTDVEPMDFPTPDSAYIFTPNVAAGSEFYVRIITEPNSDGYVSESNWIPFGEPGEEEEENPVLDIPTVPNVFTPNGDGTNDFLTIPGIGDWATRPMSIYNRWGTVVWSTNQYDNNRAFDGMGSNGRELPEGTYFFSLQLINPATSQAEEISGIITLMRNR